MLFAGTYSLLVSDYFSPAADLLLGILCGLSHVLIVMNIGHDAGHNALSQNTKVNHLACWAIEFTGLSHYMWKLNHNVIHHPYPNVRPVDSELNMALPYLRLGSIYPKRWFHRFQHIYAPFIYLFFTINLILSAIYKTPVFSRKKAVNARSGSFRSGIMYCYFYKACLYRLRACNTHACFKYCMVEGFDRICCCSFCNEYGGNVYPASIAH